MKRAAVIFSALALALGLSSAPAMAGSPLIIDISWSLGATIPNSHIEGAGAVAFGKLYVISGASGDCTDGIAGATTNAVDIYNPLTNTFSSGPSVNLARDQNPIAATVGPNIYLIGGTTGCGGASVASVERLNLRTGKWTVLPSTSSLPAPLQGVEACGAVAGTKIYEFEQAGIGVFDATTLT